VNNLKITAREFIKKYFYLYNFISYIYNIKWYIRKFFKYKVIDEDKFLRNMRTDIYFEYGDRSSIFFYAPICLDKKISSQFKSFVNNTFDFDKSIYAIYNNVDLIGFNAVVVTSTNDIIQGNAESLKVLSTCEPRLFTQPKKIKCEESYETVISLINPFNNGRCNNVFHWINESLFLLQAAEDYVAKYGDKPYILLSNNPEKYHIESLRLLGYNKTDYLLWAHERANVKKMIVPGLRRKMISKGMYLINPDAVNWLRYRLRPVIDNTTNYFSENILISRQKSIGRKIKNFEEVYAFLCEYGFESYCLEDISFKDKLRMFSNAKNIVGAHGAGLSYMMFSIKANIIELFGNPPVFYTDYYRLSQSVGLKYAYMFCDYSYENYIVSNKSSKFKEHDLIVNVDDLNKLFIKLNS
tara:strand:- start:7648 stop:8880 length:1233 start_codon:yes stop_codon:yes gene_type:complete